MKSIDDLHEFNSYNQKSESKTLTLGLNLSKTARSLISAYVLHFVILYMLPLFHYHFDTA
jgi:hypothetical protein